MSGIKQDIIERIQNSTKAKTRLAYEFAKHQSTIDRWLEELEVAESEILIEA
jgi:hypothetical protein